MYVGWFQVSKTTTMHPILVRLCSNSSSYKSSLPVAAVGSIKHRKWFLTKNTLIKRLCQEQLTVSACSAHCGRLLVCNTKSMTQKWVCSRRSAPRNPIYHGTAWLSVSGANDVFSNGILSQPECLFHFVEVGFVWPVRRLASCANSLDNT